MGVHRSQRLVEDLRQACPLTNDAVGRPRVLVIISSYLPGFRAGGPVRSIEGLVERLGSELDIFIVTLDRDFGRDTCYPNVPVGVWQKVGPARVIYLPPRSYTYRGLKPIFSEVKPDTIYLNSFFSFRFAILPLLLRRRVGAPTRVVLAPRGSVSKVALRSKRYKKLPFLWLGRQTRIFDDLSWQASSSLERDDIQHLFPNANVLVASNLQRSFDPPRSPRIKQVGALRAVFVSRIAPKKNLLYLLTLLGSMDVRLHLDIIGPKEDDDYWMECQRAIARLPLATTVTYLGEMNHEDVASELATHHLMVLPTLNENFGHVILESLCSGTPVLISDQTPWRGLRDVGAGWDLDLDHPEQFKEAIEACVALDDPGFQAMSSAAAALGFSSTNQPEALRANCELLIGPTATPR